MRDGGRSGCWVSAFRISARKKIRPSRSRGCRSKADLNSKADLIGPPLRLEYPDARDFDALDRRFAVHGHGFDTVHHVQPFDDPAEDRVLLVESRLASEHDEERRGGAGGIV